MKISDKSFVYFYNVYKGKVLIIILYIDDFVLAGNDKKRLRINYVQNFR